jgi:heptosyltransferase II
MCFYCLYSVSGMCIICLQPFQHLVCILKYPQTIKLLRLIMKILVIAPSWIGDVVMSQCLYKELHKIYDSCEIHVLAPKWCLPVLERMSEVSKTILMPIGHGEFNFIGRSQLAKILKLNKYDQAYILPNSWKSALIPFLARISIRVGWKGESRYFLINKILHNKNKYNLLIERYSALAYFRNKEIYNQAIKDLDMPSLKVEKLQQNDFSKFDIHNPSELIGICPGAEYGPAKKWPIEYYSQILQYYLDAHPQAEALILGSNKDTETGEKVISFLPKNQISRVKLLTGITSITEAIDLIACCKLIICNDSGLMHIAAAVKCKVVAIYGSTSTLYTPPLCKDSLIIESDEPCHPCFKRTCKYKTLNCLRKITPEIVISKIKNKWEKL